MPARLLSRKKLVSCSDAANHSRHLLLGRCRGVTLGIVITGKDMASTKEGWGGEREKGVGGSRLMQNTITVVKEREEGKQLCFMTEQTQDDDTSTGQEVAHSPTQ